MYARLGAWGYDHTSVNRGRGAFARDDDGDGFCEVHVHTMEGLWSLWRRWLRPHRGIAQAKLPPLPRVLRVRAQRAPARQSVASCAHCAPGHVRPWHALCASGKGDLGSWRSRTGQRRTSAEPAFADEPAGQLGMRGVYASQRLSFLMCRKTSRGKPRSAPYAGNPTVRDQRGPAETWTHGACAAGLTRPRYAPETLSDSHASLTLRRSATWHGRAPTGRTHGTPTRRLAVSSVRGLGPPDPRWHETCGERGQGACVELRVSRLLERRGAYEASQRARRPHGSKAPREQGARRCN